jgi:hypothetical protein
MKLLPARDQLSVCPFLPFLSCCIADACSQLPFGQALQRDPVDYLLERDRIFKRAGQAEDLYSWRDGGCRVFQLEQGLPFFRSCRLPVSRDQQARPTAVQLSFPSKYMWTHTDNRYLPALYDPETNTLTITPAPLYLMSHRAKRLKMAPLPSEASKEAEMNWRIKRNDLGEAFGTRKAKSQIKAQERGKVNAAAMEGVKDHLMDSIVVSEVVEGESILPLPRDSIQGKETEEGTTLTNRCKWPERIHSRTQHDHRRPNASLPTRIRHPIPGMASYRYCPNRQGQR